MELNINLFETEQIVDEIMKGGGALVSISPKCIL